MLEYDIVELPSFFFSCAECEQINNPHKHRSVLQPFANVWWPIWSQTETKYASTKQKASQITAPSHNGMLSGGSVCKKGGDFGAGSSPSFRAPRGAINMLSYFTIVIRFY